MKSQHSCLMGLFLVVASANLFFMGCASKPSVTQKLFNDMKDDSIPTFTFVQKPENGTDLYYGESYTVTYKKNRKSMGEPFLLYVETSKERTRSRTMRGLK